MTERTIDAVFAAGPQGAAGLLRATGGVGRHRGRATLGNAVAAAAQVAVKVARVAVAMVAGRVCRRLARLWDAHGAGVTRAPLAAGAGRLFDRVGIATDGEERSIGLAIIADAVYFMYPRALCGGGGGRRGARIIELEGDALRRGERKMNARSSARSDAYGLRRPPCLPPASRNVWSRAQKKQNVSAKQSRIGA